MSWIFQRFFSPLKCATCPGFSVRHAPDSVCDLPRIHCAACSGLCSKFISHTADGRPTIAVLWIANVLAAVLFGLGHLPATAALFPLTPLVITRAVVLNGLLGIAFGYLYMTRGLESAMISHFSADIVLHVLLAL